MKKSKSKKLISKSSKSKKISKKAVRKKAAKTVSFTDYELVLSKEEAYKIFEALEILYFAFKKFDVFPNKRLKKNDISKMFNEKEDGQEHLEDYLEDESYYDQDHAELI